MTTTHEAHTPLIPARSRLDAEMRTQEIGGRELARAVRVSEQSISRWRNGLRPGKEMRERIAKKLGVEARELWP